MIAVVKQFPGVTHELVAFWPEAERQGNRATTVQGTLNNVP
jgi:hypothetical protein